VLSMVALQDQPPVSMLVMHIEAEFYKKADQTILFTCEQGQAIQKTIQEALATGESRTFRAESVGTLPDGNIASKVWITWSFKTKKNT
jgi:hypothetical protein